MNKLHWLLVSNPCRSCTVQAVWPWSCDLHSSTGHGATVELATAHFFGLAQTPQLCLQGVFLLSGPRCWHLLRQYVLIQVVSVSLLSCWLFFHFLFCEGNKVMNQHDQASFFAFLACSRTSSNDSSGSDGVTWEIGLFLESFPVSPVGAPASRLDVAELEPVVNWSAKSCMAMSPSSWPPRHIAMMRFVTWIGEVNYCALIWCVEKQ